ncbi:MAG: DNA polymerase III subunit gamma/tau [Bacillota bacterium]|jgi:DNA polymerase-3 subunit gamma/tau
MTYQALYRKWRPQTFAEVVGQPHIVRTLQNMLRQGRVYHAFLFCGPRGTGKTTLAKLLAKALNCQAGPTAEPCLACSACQAIKAGNFVDVLEIDGASNRGIDEIRELRERVKYAPAEGRYKVYIIDEVHMLTTEAFNALLKTLEEPPEHVKFVFATTEVHKVPATILSRCQRFDFRRISPGVIEQELSRLCEKADIPADPTALRLIASAANGGMRDALSMLDQVQSYAGGQTITDGDVQEVVGLVPDVLFGQLLSSLLRSDLQSALDQVDNLIERGKEVAQITDGFCQYARNCLLHLAGLTPEGFVPPEDQVTAEYLTELLQGLLAVEKDLRYVTNQRVLLDLALFRACRGRPSPSTPAQQRNYVPSSSSIVDAQRPVVVEGKLHHPAIEPEPSQVVEPAKPTGKLVADRPADDEADSPQPLSADSSQSIAVDSSQPAAVEPEGAAKQPVLTLRQLQQRWAGFVAKVMDADPSVGAPLSSARVQRISELVVTLRFDKGFARNVVDEHKRFLEETLQQEMGLPLRLQCVVEDKAPQQADEVKHPPDEAERIALSLFEGQTVDMNHKGSDN